MGQIVCNLQIIEKVIGVVGQNMVRKKRKRDGGDRRESHRGQD